jgi:hypothetical protein
MTVFVGKHFQPTTQWMALDIDEKWRIGRLITENGKRYIIQNGIKYQVKANHKPQVYK